MRREKVVNFFWKKVHPAIGNPGHAYEFVHPWKKSCRCPCPSPSLSDGTEYTWLHHCIWNCQQTLKWVHSILRSAKASTTIVQAFIAYVAWTGSIRCCMVCRSTCCGKSSRCKTPPLVYWPAHSAVTTSLQCCVSFIGCRFRDEWNLRLRVSYTNRSLQWRQRTCLSTLDSSPSMVVLISVHLLTEYWLFHGRAPASGTEVSLLRDRARGTLCRLRYNRWPATDSSGDIWKHICLEPTNHGAL